MQSEFSELGPGIRERATSIPTLYSREDYGNSFTNVADINECLKRHNVPCCRLRTPAKMYLAVGKCSSDFPHDERGAGDGTTVMYSVFELPKVMMDDDDDDEMIPPMFLAVEKTVRHAHTDCRSIRRGKTGCFASTELPIATNDTEIPSPVTNPPVRLAAAEISESDAVEDIGEKTIIAPKRLDSAAGDTSYPTTGLKMKRLLLMAKACKTARGVGAGHFLEFFLTALNGRDRKRITDGKNRHVSSNRAKRLVLKSYSKFQKLINHSCEWLFERKFQSESSSGADIKSQINVMLGAINSIDYIPMYSAINGADSANLSSQNMKLLSLTEALKGGLEDHDNISLASQQLPMKRKFQWISKKSWIERSLKKISFRKKKHPSESISEEFDPVLEEYDGTCCRRSCNPGPKNDRNDREVAMEKRSYVMDELVKTERDYVHCLSLVVKDYIEAIRNPSAAEKGEMPPVPENLMRPDVQNIIFCNIEQIYEWHKNVLLKEIESCSGQPLKICNIFKNNESNFFFMYTVYCQKNKVFDCFVREYSSFFEDMQRYSCHMYPLSDFLIRPVNRIMTYTLLLREMLKYSKQADLKDQLEYIQQAIDVMERLTKNIDEMMVVDQLQDFDGNITAQGKLLMHESLRCALNPGRGSRNKDTYNDLHVFLFERSMIFTAEDGKKRKSTGPNYVYKTQIMMNNMKLKDEYIGHSSNDSSNVPFLVESIDPESLQEITCQAQSTKSREKWLKNLRAVLKTQYDFQAALQMPLKVDLKK